MSTVTRRGFARRVKVSDTVPARMSGDDRAAALSANIAAYDSVDDKTYVNGAPHLKHASIANTYKSIVDSAIKHIGRDAKTVSVLELGAGNGLASTPWFARHVLMTAVDSSESMLRGLSKRAAAFGLSPVTVTADAAAFLNSTDETFDVITHRRGGRLRGLPRRTQRRGQRPDGRAPESIVRRGRGHSLLVHLQPAAADAGRAGSPRVELRDTCFRTDVELIEDHNAQARTFGTTALTGIQGGARRVDLRRAIHEAHLDWPPVLLVVLGVLAAAVRLYRLTGRSLWLDETVTAQSAHLNTVGEVIAQSTVYVNQAPLFYLVTWILRPWGDGEFVLRLPAMVAGTLTVPAVYPLCKRAFGARVARIAALPTASTPHHLSQPQR